MPGPKENQMKDAIQKLSKYGKVADTSAFYEKVLSAAGTSSNTQAPLNLTSEVLETFISMFDGSKYMNSILLTLNEKLNGVPVDNLVTLTGKFNIIAANSSSPGQGMKNGSCSIERMMGDYAPAVGSNNPSKTAGQTGISLAAVYPAALNYAQRGTGAVEVFMNMIPTLEWSRATPYMDIQVITPGAEMTSEGRISGLGQLKFLNGKVSRTMDTADYKIGTSQTKAVSDQQTQAQQENPTAKFSSAGMEIFTSPQTLVPANEEYRSYASIAELEAGERNALGEANPFPGQPGSGRSAPVIDRMRPFMSLTSVSIKVMPTRGMMSTKRAEINLTLHDRSRLSEIAELVSPSMFGKTELLLEYGWSHPDSPGGNGNTDNPFGSFIDSLRVVEKYGVFNSKYTFTDDGQVQINLYCVTRGDTAARVTNVGISKKAVPLFRAIESLIEAIRNYQDRLVETQPSMANVTGMSSIASLSPTNAAELFGDEEVMTEIQNFIDNSQNSSAAALAITLDKTVKAVELAQTTVAAEMQNKINIAESKGDPFLKPKSAAADSSTVLPQWANHPYSPKDTSNWCSFGRFASLFIAHPLANTGKFDDIQMYFYTFNEKAGWLHNCNISQFPLDLSGTNPKGLKSRLTDFAKEKLQISVNDIMNWLNTNYFSNMAAKAYGFKLGDDVLFKRNDEGAAEINSSPNGRGNTIRQQNFSNYKDQVLEQAYGPGHSPTFTLPRVQMIAEAIPHVQAENAASDTPGREGTILRLHFVDQSASKFSSLHELLLSQRNDQIGLVNSVANSINHGPDGSDWQTLRTNLEQAMAGVDGDSFFEDVGGYRRVKGGIPSLVHKIKQTSPTIEWGTQNGSMKSISVASMHNSSDATIHMLRAQREGGGDAAGPAGSIDRGLPQRVMPMTFAGECLGCPVLQFGQKFFMETGTGTTVDNIYAVSGLEHKITPGDFSTSFSMLPLDSYGRYESSLSQVNRAIAKLNSSS